MKETIGDMRIRYVFQKYITPTKKVDEAYRKGRDDGWNACMSYLKSVGKI